MLNVRIVQVVILELVVIIFVQIMLKIPWLEVLLGHV